MIETDKIYNEDCLNVMASMPDGSVDAIVTDPPYGLNFMGVAWDTFDGRENGGRSDATFDKVGGNHHPVNAADQARTRKAENEKFQSSMLPIFAEAYRVAKPGAHLLAFGGTRTYHRLACAIEDAGWEIRDCIMWVYGSGVPKGMDVSKAIDRSRGLSTRFQEMYAAALDKSGKSHSDIDKALGLKSSSCYWVRTDHRKSFPTRDSWEKLKKTIEFPENADEIYDEAARLDRVVSDYSDRNVLSSVKTVVSAGTPRMDEAADWNGWNTALKPAVEPIVVARKPVDGTVAANVLKYGTGALNIDGCRVPTEETVVVHSPARKTLLDSGHKDLGTWENTKGRFPANLIHDGSDEVTALFPDTGKSSGGGMHTKGIGENKGGNAYGAFASGEPTDAVGFGDTGSAARFFYCAKASRKEKNLGCESLPDGNFHVTVKPVELMRYLVRLVCRRDGLVLDPFAGSGTTCIACKMEGMDFIGCELNPQYAEIAEKRISAWSAEPENADDAPEQAEEPRSPTETFYNVDEL